MICTLAHSRSYSTLFEVMNTKLLPTSDLLSRQRGESVGPNGHWLSRLPAKLKSPKQREKLVSGLQHIQEELATLGDAWHRYSHIL